MLMKVKTDEKSIGKINEVGWVIEGQWQTL